MKYDELIKALRSYASDCDDDDACSQCTFAWMCERLDGNAPKIIADALEALQAENRNLRNELCLKCGRYKEAHNGACNGCRWKEK